MIEEPCTKHKLVYEKLFSEMDFQGQWSAEFYSTSSELISQALRIVGQVRLDSSNGDFKADCPWQACLFLLFRALLLADENFPDRAAAARVVGLDELGVTLTIFRGQRDSRWGFYPSILQPQLTCLEREKAASVRDLFCAILHEGYLARGGQELSHDVFIAIAQHYQLRTHFLDFTVDPSVAIFFANLGAEQGVNSVVYSLPLAKILHEVRIILPPPFVRRLYLQRGFFVEVAGNDANHLKKLGSRVVFPARSDFLPYRWNPDPGDCSIDLVPGNQLFETLKNIAEKDAKEVIPFLSSAEDCKKHARSIADKYQLASKLFQDTELNDDWLSCMEMMMKHLVYFRVGDEYRVAVDVLDKVIDDNPNTVVPLAEEMRQHADTLKGTDSGRRSQVLALAELFAERIVRAQWLQRLIELSDEDLLQARSLDFSDKEIAEEAFRIWSESGFTHGHDQEDWFQAKLVLSRRR